jgi:hypothetical protein
LPLAVTASNGSGSATQDFTLTVNEAPTITSMDNPTFSVGSPGGFTVTTTGFPAATLTASGSLPGGVSFVDNGDGTATVSGTPDAGSGGVYKVSVTAGNGIGDGVTQTFTLTVNEAPALTSADTTTFTAGSAGTFTVTTTGFPGALLMLSGGLPGGVSFVDNGDGTATLSGTPMAGSGGVYTFSVTATNGAGSATQTFTLTVDETLGFFTSADNATFYVGSPGSFTVTTTGFLATTLTASGSLPDGVSFVDNGDGTATLSGTPVTAGTYTLTLTASNGMGDDVMQTFTLTVGKGTVAK